METLLSKATRDELIEELKKRKSITFVGSNEGEGTTIAGMFGNISISQEAYIFVITPNELKDAE